MFRLAGFLGLVKKFNVHLHLSFRVIVLLGCVSKSFFCFGFFVFFVCLFRLQLCQLFRLFLHEFFVVAIFGCFCVGCFLNAASEIFIHVPEHTLDGQRLWCVLAVLSGLSEFAKQSFLLWLKHHGCWQHVNDSLHSSTGLSFFLQQSCSSCCFFEDYNCLFQGSKSLFGLFCFCLPLGIFFLSQSCSLCLSILVRFDIGCELFNFSRERCNPSFELQHFLSQSSQRCLSIFNCLRFPCCCFFAPTCKFVVNLLLNFFVHF
mmetsp:Transcript_21554/g.42097  ORF Transcript_21554/g.42097 Transcript_21554/m.42097 type:complete len:260 (+) Transcript_21554:1412-2191(+)